MVKINNFQIINNGQDLSIDLETSLGFNITSIKLWNNYTFKDYDLALNLNYKIEAVNNKEIFIITANEAQVPVFKDIYFIEATSNEEDENDNCTDCSNPALGITYTMLPYYNCLLNYVLENKDSNCLDCNKSYINPIAITINLLIDSIEKGIDSGYYSQSIGLLSELKRLCGLKECTNCEKINCTTCSKFTQY